MVKPAQGRLELAHVLFMDIVGYSKKTMDEQRTLVRELNGLVSHTKSYKKAKSNHELVCLPTGDGMAIAFFGDPRAAVQCAVEIAGALRAKPFLMLRIGINTGPVFRVADINQNLNITGGGINVAQRIMDCGDEGHILVSRNSAEVLLELEEWKPFLQNLGESEVKHGARVHLYNLVSANFGNKSKPGKFRSQQRGLPTLNELQGLLRGNSLDEASLDDISWIAQLEADTYDKLDAVPESLLRGWYETNPSGFFILKNSSGERIGHLDILPVRPDAMASFVAGDIREREIRPSDLYPKSERGLITSVYIESIIIRAEGHTATALVSVLSKFATILSNMCSLENLEFVYAMAATREGKELITHLGLKPISGFSAQDTEGHQLFRTTWASLATTLDQLSERFTRPKNTSSE
jgi:class 3 adenylate cyclase